MSPESWRRTDGSFSALEDPYEDAPIGYFTTDTDGVVVRVNQTFLEWTGYTLEAVVGRRRLADFLNIGGKMYLETHFQPALHLHGHIYEIALDLLRADGSTLPALVNAVRRRDAIGNDLFTRVTVFKAEERRRYEQELLLARRETELAAKDLARANAELTRANQALLISNDELARFTYAASHDLQAPLRGLSMYTEMLERRLGEQLDAPIATCLARIRASAGRMQSLVADLLDLSQAGGVSIARTEIDLGTSLTSALGLLDGDIAQSGAIIEAGPLPKVLAEPRQATQLLQNLIGNALKYRHSERPPIIQVAAERGERSWQITVRDNGIGFDMQHAERIFEPFRRLHGAEIAGSGIGLALCRKIVEAHGGRIWAESTPGAGSVFSFTIPDAVAP